MTYPVAAQVSQSLEHSSLSVFGFVEQLPNKALQRTGRSVSSSDVESVVHAFRCSRPVAELGR